MSARRFPAICLLVFAFVVSGCGRTIPIGWSGVHKFEPESPPVFRHTDGVRIASLNTEFMFDGSGDEGQATFPHKGDSLLSRQHRSRIANVVEMIDADLVLLSEVENEKAVQMMLDENGIEGYTVHFVEGFDSFTGQDVALISRIPVDTVGRSNESLPIRPSDQLQHVSKNMFARVTIGSMKLSLIGVHFLARPTDPARRQKRELQAEIIRQQVVRELDLGRSVVVLGDFNDFDPSTPDLIGSKPISNVLERIRSAGPGPDDDLHNLIADVPQAVRFTSHYDRNNNDRVDNNELSAIDHILVSPELYRKVREVRYVHAYDPAKVSDHFPVVFSFAVD